MAHCQPGSERSANGQTATHASMSGFNPIPGVRRFSAALALNICDRLAYDRPQASADRPLVKALKQQCVS